jgi:hypothetical protein
MNTRIIKKIAQNQIDRALESILDCSDEVIHLSSDKEYLYEFFVNDLYELNVQFNEKTFEDIYKEYDKLRIKIIYFLEKQHSTY